MEKKFKQKENIFRFSNINKKDYIKTNQKIQNLLIFENEKDKNKENNKYIFDKFHNEIKVYYFKTFKLKFKILLNSKDNEKYNNEEYEEEFKEDKFEIVNKKHYGNNNYIPFNSDILFITKKFIISINLDLNEGKVIDVLKTEKYINFLKRDFEIENKIHTIEYLSNLDVFINAENNYTIWGFFLQEPRRGLQKIGKLL